MRTRKETRDYVLDSIQPGEDYKAFKDDKEQVEYMLSTFEAEKPEEIARRGRREAFHSWIWGLPSTFAMDYYDEDIERRLRSWGVDIPEGSDLSRIWSDTLWDAVLDLREINNIRIF